MRPQTHHSRRAALRTPPPLPPRHQRLSELVQEAYKDAHGRSVAAMKERMKALAQQMGLPGNIGPGAM
jgi:hypothetical protein